LFLSIQAEASVLLEPERQHPMVAKLVVKLLEKEHYQKYSVTDSISEKQYTHYLTILDHNKSFFLVSDVDRFDRFRFQLDDYMNSGNVDPAYYIFNTFVERVDQRVKYLEKILEKPFDFTMNEFYEPDRETAPWAQSAEELDEIWRKRLKYEALSLKLADKDWDSIAATLTKRYSNFQKRIVEYSAEDVFQIFMTSLAESFDPHSGYMSPFDSDNFGIRMSLSFQGIGAQLSSEDDYTKVVEIIPGGPAALGGELKPNDKIVGVGQGDDGEIVDVIGMRLDDVVLKIRGQKNTVVRLEIIPAEALSGNPTQIIRIVRDEVILTEREAKSDTVEMDFNGHAAKLGVIKIPSFYADYESRQQGVRDYRSTTNDVRKLIQDLKAAGVQGIVIDLRQNTGGFLQEAISLTGLFIQTGPVVQVRRPNGIVEVESDNEADIEYDGPLVVLVDRFSASASEIFAAAIQDYKRGVVVGSQTFGKGTVQTLVRLNNYLPYYKGKLGQVRVTMAKFYRIAGGSTQHTGVIPDIGFPSIYNEMDIGESKELNALLWDEINSATFAETNDVNPYLVDLKEKSRNRILLNAEFNYLLQDIEEFKIEKDKKTISLNENVRRAEREQREADDLKRLNERRVARGLKPLAQSEKEPDSERLELDPWLEESQRVLVDFIDQRDHRIAKTKGEK
jgi:carboxyl-terminal processing protease